MKQGRLNKEEVYYYIRFTVFRGYKLDAKTGEILNLLRYKGRGNLTLSLGKQLSLLIFFVQQNYHGNATPLL
jgi:hypothetical protein